RLVDCRGTGITNAPDIANVLVDRAGVELILLGGAVRPRVHSMLGHLAELASTELRAAPVFMGIGAITPTPRLVNEPTPEIQTDRALRRMARSVVVLADATKFDAVAPAWVFGLEEVSTIVTDSTLAPDRVADFERRGVRMIVAPELPAP